VKKPLVIKPLVFERLAALSKDNREECWDALLQLAEAFGQPHLHRGIGIRKLGGLLFEQKEIHEQLDQRSRCT